ncbi:MAG: hypothetical protein IPM02_26795 [Betaproteobacteria bacterium]|nr:hypothetical protein [Betaproteobacteria bacterium]
MTLIPANNVIHVRGDRRRGYPYMRPTARMRTPGWMATRPPDRPAAGIKGESILGSVNRNRIALGDVNRDIFDYMHARMAGGSSSASFLTIGGRNSYNATLLQRE